MTKQASETGSTPVPPILPPEVSGDGKRNAYHHQCAIIGNQQAYASCVDKLARRKHGALPVIFSDCSAAIGKKVCPAIAMRKEELAAGKAIYFIERQRFTGLSVLIDKAKEMFKPLPQTPKKTSPGPRPEKAPVPAIGGDYMAQAITKAVERHVGGPKPTGQAVNVRPGETLLEAARRIRGITQN